MTARKISELRKQSADIPLNSSSVNPNPFKQFSKWFEQALKSGLLEPNSMAVATATRAGRPSTRILLLKGYSEKGFIFFTNYKSRKGKELEENPYASLLFFWEKTERQVRIEGRVKKISQEETKEYFDTRPYESRLGAWASMQSSVIESRDVISKKYMKYFQQYRGEVPVPPYWGGYCLEPDYFEFWQGRPNRLHDRIRYKKTKGVWKIDRLSP